MKNKLLPAWILSILLSGCTICLICNGMRQQRCKMALPVIKPYLDSMYLLRFNAKHWAILDCHCDDPGKGIVFETTTNPAHDSLGIIVSLDSNLNVVHLHYPRGYGHR